MENNKKENIIAMIPARIGSTRLKMKNIALVNGKPLISYAIEAAKDSGVFNRIILNSDSKIFSAIAKRHNISFYLRPVELGSSTTKSDLVVYDFMLKHQSDVVAWVNPTSPLQTGNEIRDVIKFFIKEHLDSLITVKDEQVHCIYDGGPVNFNINEMFSQTQDLKPVQHFVYSIMVWKSKIFLKMFEEQGYAFLCGKFGFYPISKMASIIIKTKEDLMLADYIMRAKKKYKVKYDEVIKKFPEVNK